MPRYTPEPLPPAERAAFSGAVNIGLHGYDLAALDRLRKPGGETRAECGRRLLRQGLQALDVRPYAGEHEVEVACPVCQEPAALTVWVTWVAGAPDVGILPGWKGQTATWGDALWGDEESMGNRNPECGCTLSEPDTLSACERAVEQWERSLLSGEARENARAEP